MLDAVPYTEEELEGGRSLGPEESTQLLAVFAAPAAPLLTASPASMASLMSSLLSSPMFQSPTTAAGGGGGGGYGGGYGSYSPGSGRPPRAVSNPRQARPRGNTLPSAPGHFGSPNQASKSIGGCDITKAYLGMPLISGASDCLGRGIGQPLLSFMMLSFVYVSFPASLLLRPCPKRVPWTPPLLLFGRGAWFRHQVRKRAGGRRGCAERRRR